jgi:hypothetical protein
MRRRSSLCARRGAALLPAIVLLAASAPLRAAELKPETVAAFERYQRAAEAAIAADIETAERFLRILHTAPDGTRNRQDQLHKGEVAVARLQVTENGKRIPIPDGLVHHWMGAVFVPGARVADAVAMMQDYDRHAEIFRPAIARARTIDRDGDRFRIFLRFFMKKVITVVVNTESTAVFTRLTPQRTVSAIRSTRIQELESAGTPHEREKPVGRDGGYLWRLNSYWRFLEQDDGTYIECETLTLTRSIPIGFGWIVGPFVTGLPRELLAATLQTARKALGANRR